MLTSEKKQRILLITDFKKSSFNQVLGISNLIKKKTDISVYHYKFSIDIFNFLPNSIIFFLLNIGFFKKKINLKHDNFSIIISCGRISAPLNLFLKKRFSSKSIHIFNPYFKASSFDKIVLPNHDKPIGTNNLIRIDGSIVNDENNFISRKDLEYFKINIPLNSKKENICVLLGGNGKSSFFSKNDIYRLLEYLLNINTMKYKLFFISSRRTPEILKKIIYKNFHKNSYIWNEEEKNPYWYLLKKCDLFIVTSDSVSMTSEVISTKKSVFVFFVKKIKDKILKFQENLILSGRTKKFEGKIYNWKFKIPKNTQKVVRIILKDLDL